MATPRAETIETVVPEGQGFLPMSLPTDPTTRFSKDEITLSPATEEDLEAIAAGLHAAFPEGFWWSGIEPLASRPAPAVRVARYMARLRPVIDPKHAPHFSLIVARVKATGEVAGCAGWHHPTTTTTTQGAGGVRGCGPNMWLCDLPAGTEPAVGWESGFPWREGERDAAWEGLDVAAFARNWGRFEVMREEEMKGAPHWYLAPFYTEEKFRGKGVGSMLLRWAIDQADKEEPSVAMYLEALPNARPVYLHAGFRGVPGENRDLSMVRRGPLKGSLTKNTSGEFIEGIKNGALEFNFTGSYDMRSQGTVHLVTENLQRNLSYLELQRMHPSLKLIPQNAAVLV